MKSKSVPPTTYVPVEMFVQEVTRDVKRLIQQVDFRDHVPNNLSPHERIALRELTKRNDIICKPADDKGGSVVIMDPQAYENEIKRQLEDDTVYKPLQSDPTWSIRKILESIVKPAFKEGLISHDLYEFLLPTHTRIPVLYILPKIHKDKHSPPGRPIVSGRDSIFVPTAKLLDRVLSPLVKTTPSYIKDSGDFLTKIGDLPQIQDGCILVTWDVTSLYTSIPHVAGIEAALNLIKNCHEYSEAQIAFFEKLFKIDLV